MKKFILPLVFSLLFILSGRTQPQVIDSLNIIPVLPILGNTVSVIAYTYHTYSACSLISSSVSIIGDSIIVRAEHMYGMAPAICNSIDTIAIGALNTGTYTLVYILEDSSQFMYYDTAIIQFAVLPGTGLNDEYANFFIAEISPNPVSSIITLQLSHVPSGKYRVELYTLNGQLLRSFQTLQTINSMDMSTHPDGIYLIRIILSDQRTWCRKIIKKGS